MGKTGLKGANQLISGAIQGVLKGGLSIGYKSMAPQVGLEPTTLRLTAECSAIELLKIA